MSTMVLVAGAWLGGWAWERVTPELVAAGHDVHPLTLTGLGDRAHLSSPEITLSTHVADIVSAIEYADLRDVVLVAHSYSSAPATIAANRIPGRISRVVYVAAVLALAGRSLFDIFPPAAAQAIQQSADAEGDGWLLPMMDDDMLDAYLGTYIVCTGDPQLPLPAGVEFEAGHWPMATKPAELAALLSRIATGVR